MNMDYNCIFNKKKKRVRRKKKKPKHSSYQDQNVTLLPNISKANVHDFETVQYVPTLSVSPALLLVCPI